jgi:hypothetical protein
MAAAAGTRVGSRDEAGFLNGLKRGGFNEKKSMLELIANSLDAKATRVILTRTYESYLLKDNGTGMSTKGYEKMFCAQLENHSRDRSRGVSGYGSKPALVKLSNTSTVRISSHRDGMLTKAIVPWDKMYALKRYDGMIEVSDPVVSEQPTSGTTIEFERNDVMDKYFERLWNGNIPIDDNPVFVFGSDRFVFTLEDQATEEGERKTRALELFNYFGKHHRRDYYLGCDQYDIDVYYDVLKQRKRFILTYND